MRFKDKVVIVTGAAGGIGGAISARFAAEGAEVVVTDMNGEGAEATAAQIIAEGGRARAFASDISAAEGCRAIVESVIATEGRIDVLCNNAGINRRGNLLVRGRDDGGLGQRRGGGGSGEEDEDRPGAHGGPRRGTGTGERGPGAQATDSACGWRVAPSP